MRGAQCEVRCDMTTDGGDYSFLKLSGPGHYASQAEAECDKYGMNLFIPRTLDHKNSAWAIANDANIGPDASANYMYILGIYPKQNGATCVQQPMNSSNMNCGWKASDDGPWYVHEVNNTTEPNGDNNAAQGSSRGPGDASNPAIPGRRRDRADKPLRRRREASSRGPTTAARSAARASVDATAGSARLRHARRSGRSPAPRTV